MALEVESSNPSTHPTTFNGVSPSGKARDFDFRIRWFKSSYPSHKKINTLLYIGVSPSGKATDSDSVIRRFESYYPCQYGSLAQLVEHMTFNHGVPGSIPG